MNVVEIDNQGQNTDAPHGHDVGNIPHGGVQSHKVSLPAKGNGQGIPGFLSNLPQESPILIRLCRQHELWERMGND